MPSPKRPNGRSLRASSRTIPARKAAPRQRLPKVASKSSSTTTSVAQASALPKIQKQFLETITAAVDSGRTLEDVAGVCLRFLLDATHARGSSVHLYDEQTKELRCVSAHGTLNRKPSAELSGAIASAIKTQRPVATADLHVYPVKRARTLDGVMVVQGLSIGKGTEWGADLLEFMALRLSAALDHARLVQKYAQKIARIQQLEEVSEILNSTLDEQEIIRRAVETASKLVGAEAGSLLLLSEETGELTFLVAVGDKGVQLQEIRLKVGQGIAGLVAQTGQPLIVNDARQDPRVAHHVDERTGFTTRSILAVPVRARNKTLGVLEAVNKRGERPFSNWDLLEFGSLANQVAIALENSRLFRKSSEKIKRLVKFKEISALLNSTLNQAEIRSRAIEAATVLMEAEAGSLLLLDEAAGELYFEVALGEKGEGVRQIRLKVGQGIAGHVAKTGQPEIINDCYSDPRFNREADKKSGFRTRNMVCVPVKARDKMLGVLQAINKKGDGSFAEDDLQDFISLGHQVGIAIENANLYEEINRLFEGFISASVLAIESRDPTTSGHSGRVATLTCGLAEIVDRVDRGPYADITFDYDQMKEIRYAAVLHDFGKVGVREHVLIKADKLFPQDLARLKARFDFIKRTLEVKALRKKVDILKSGDRTATAEVLAEVDEELARQITETDGVLEFILACNKPTVLKTGGFERLHEIAQQNFDHFDGPRSFLTQQEVLTLSIPKGSLTTEERLEIESHVAHTYRFLSTIPWTKSLKNIPIIAYGHHEKLDGTGYPRQVPGDTIPVQTRMMTISDIYDALTASDRPYKAAVPTPKALAILEDEMRHGKVDAQLLQLFVEAKVYERVKS
ncbi:MAG TPA: GAF domain-containing protein [Nitrospiraceae bacterium]|nr:GAF domain-containing protein [Nitrospiraceae bacterium]